MAAVLKEEDLVETRIARLEADVANIRSDVSELKSDMGEVKKDVLDLKVKVSDLQGQMKTMFATLDAKIDKVALQTRLWFLITLVPALASTLFSAGNLVLHWVKG